GGGAEEAYIGPPASFLLSRDIVQFSQGYAEMLFAKTTQLGPPPYHLVAPWLTPLCGTSTSNMSCCVPVADAVDDTCANCGKQGSDTVKLKNCTACRLVKYCGVDCQRAHRKQHKKACKQRAAELQDEELYSQGHERPEGEFCPICALPIPLPVNEHSLFEVCCMKTICDGCDLAVQKRGMFDCAFCRTPRPDNDADELAMIRARVKKKDPEAIFFLGSKFFFGELGLQKDMRRAVELWTEAAELGSIDALFDLGNAYFNGDGVQEDKGKAAELYKKAAMQGHVECRYSLGNHEGQKGNYDRAVKHWMISAKMGDKDSIENIKSEAYFFGLLVCLQVLQAFLFIYASDPHPTPPRQIDQKPEGANDPRIPQGYAEMPTLPPQAALRTSVERSAATSSHASATLIRPTSQQQTSTQLQPSTSGGPPPPSRRAFPAFSQTRLQSVHAVRRADPPGLPLLSHFFGRGERPPVGGEGGGASDVFLLPVFGLLIVASHCPGVRGQEVSVLIAQSKLYRSVASISHFSVGVPNQLEDLPLILPSTTEASPHARPSERGLGEHPLVCVPALSAPPCGLVAYPSSSTKSPIGFNSYTAATAPLPDRSEARRGSAARPTGHPVIGDLRSSLGLRVWKDVRDAPPAPPVSSLGLWLLIPIGQAGLTPIFAHSKTTGILNLTMSCVPVADDGDEICANCGKHGSDTVKLKICTACRIVKYCGVDCQRAHRKQHKKACKQRAAEIKDEQLYSQGHERQEGDFCPICALPIPLPVNDHSFLKACCMKRICRGCSLATRKRGMFDCAFCRAPMPNNYADELAMIRARVKKKDPEAILFLGQKYSFGSLELQKDTRKAVELLTEAAELGSIDALFDLGNAYFKGNGVQEDTRKAYEFYKKAAMQGHVECRHNLGNHEGRKGNFDRAIKHYMISAKMGHEDSVGNIKQLFMAGFGTNDQYMEALRGYQNAVEEMKSNDRNEAKRLDLESKD
ncbi:hypothetical protein THAOC_01729, partial [Thalassiosira oceanica]